MCRFFWFLVLHFAVSIVENDARNGPVALARSIYSYADESVGCRRES
jgi:hypothetical protein